MSEFFTITFLIQLITSAIGSIGFAMIYRVAGKYLPFAALGGVLTFALPVLAALYWFAAHRNLKEKEYR